MLAPHRIRFEYHPVNRQTVKTAVQRRIKYHYVDNGVTVKRCRWLPG